MKNILMTSAICFVLAHAASGQTVVTLPDGSKAILKADKTWEPIGDKPVAYIKPNSANMLDFVPTPPKDALVSILTINKYDFDKSEFETEKQYIERLKKLARDTKLDALSKDDKRLGDAAFVFDDVADYNAETQVFRFDLIGIAYKSINAKFKPRLNYAVELYRRSYGSWMPEYGTSFRIPPVPVPREKAAAVKPAMQLAVYGFPIGFSKLGDAYIIKFVPTRIVAFDRTTGEIFSDIDTQKER